MKVFNIKKKNGTYRTIYAPSYTEKWQLRLKCLELNEIVKKECNPNIVHGFVQGKSPVTNAMAHRNKKYTLSMDLKDFFDTITPQILNQNRIPDDILWGFGQCFYAGAARQGLPTSPAVSNLACVKMDDEIYQICRRSAVVYTRYADDLTFSGNELMKLQQIKITIGNIISNFGFTVNEKKTRIQSAKYGRRNITGINVDSQIHPTRKIRRRLRAARHQGNWPEARGLGEWCKLKTPNPQGGCNITPVQKTYAKQCALKIRERSNYVL